MPTKGMSFKQGALCLTATSTERLAPVVLGACNFGSKWLSTDEGWLGNAAVSTEYRFLRHHPPSGTCAEQTPLDIGIAKSDLNTRWDAAKHRLVSTGCAGMCVGAAVADTAGVQAVLLPCTDTRTAFIAST